MLVKELLQYVDALENYKHNIKKTALQSTRSGMEDGPTRTDNKEKIGMAMSNDPKIPRKCSFEWSKVTTQLSLCFHQGEAKSRG